jgi:hypothetical protein
VASDREQQRQMDWELGMEWLWELAWVDPQLPVEELEQV